MRVRDRKAAAKKAAATNQKKHGLNFYQEIGKLGGVACKTGGFASDKIGSDGLTGRERAKQFGHRYGFGRRTVSCPS